MIPALIKLRGDVDELQERMDAMKLRVESLEEKLELHRLRAQMLSAHVENLIDRVADLEGDAPAEESLGAL